MKFIVLVRDNEQGDQTSFGVWIDDCCQEDKIASIRINAVNDILYRWYGKDTTSKRFTYQGFYTFYDALEWFDDSRAHTDISKVYYFN